MPSQSRIGNSLFFTGLIVLVAAAVIWSASEGDALSISLALALVALFLMGVGGWLWNKPDPGAPVPLSRIAPKGKILAAITGLITLYVSGRLGEADKVGRFLGVGLLAYAMAGAVEAVIDKKYPNAKANWDALSAWKKFWISTVAIVASYFVFTFAMMGIARR